MKFCGFNASLCLLICTNFRWFIWIFKQNGINFSRSTCHIWSDDWCSWCWWWYRPGLFMHFRVKKRIVISCRHVPYVNWCYTDYISVDYIISCCMIIPSFLLLVHNNQNTLLIVTSCSFKHHTVTPFVRFSHLLQIVPIGNGNMTWWSSQICISSFFSGLCELTSSSTYLYSVEKWE